MRTFVHLSYSIVSWVETTSRVTRVSRAGFGLNFVKMFRAWM